jgi:hypothetical protein
MHTLMAGELSSHQHASTFCHRGSHVLLDVLPLLAFFLSPLLVCPLIAHVRSEPEYRTPSARIRPRDRTSVSIHVLPFHSRPFLSPTCSPPHEQSACRQDVQCLHGCATRRGAA